VLLATLSKILILALAATLQTEAPMESGDGSAASTHSPAGAAQEPSGADAGANQEPSTEDATPNQEPSAKGAAPNQEPSAEEVAALEAWRALQNSFKGPEQSTRAAFEQYLTHLFLKVEQFSLENLGTAASFEARHELALMEIHARQQRDRGLARMKQIHADVQKYVGPPPDGLRLDLKRYTFVYAIALADAEQFLQAEALLHPIAASAKLGDNPDPTAAKNSDAAQAADIIARIKVQKTLLVGLPMPEFSGKRLRDGTELKLSELKGKVVLIQFWATWSKPCDQEMPAISKVYHEFAAQDFLVLGISLDDDRRDGRNRLHGYLKQKNMPWPQLYDGKGWEAALARKFFVRSIPSSFLLDKDGMIRAKDLRARDLRNAVLPLIKSPL
jgi:peroxiredoxin